MILNESFTFHEVRFQINSRLSDDFALSFVGSPNRVLLPSGTVLVRLDFPIVFGIFMKPWWLKPEALNQILRESDGTAAGVRRAWQNKAALPKASRGSRTLVIEVELTAPAYAWVGRASSLFNKSGGCEQVYLPNLARGSGPNRSDFARVRHTYTLPAF